MKKVFMITLALVFAVSGATQVFSKSANTEKSHMSGFTEELALKFSEMALNCIEKEYPNKPSHVFNDKKDLKTPAQQHPAFYGCFDWHSSVHGHWMLVRVLKVFPEIKIKERILAALKRNITVDNIAGEVAYLNEKSRKSFERTYGWAWLLKLSEELYTWKDPSGRALYKTLSPLTEKIVANYLNFLPKQTYPIRTGVHPNTAFGLLFALDYARTMKNSDMEELIKKRSWEYYLRDYNCPDDYEPGGEDFFSPCLMEALLMSRLMSNRAFRPWFRHLLPNMNQSSLLIPAIVSDRTDGKLSHLDGLNLSRVWCFSAILKKLQENDPLVGILKKSIKDHLSIAMENIRSGHYAGEHWLGSFAVYAYSEL